MSRWPLGPLTYTCEVQARIAVRLVQIDRRKNPDAYTFPYRGVEALAERLRRDTSCPYTGYFFLISMSKAILGGMTMDAWRQWAGSQSFDVMRAIHKRPFTPRASRGR